MCNSLFLPLHPSRPALSLYQPKNCAEGEDPCAAQGDRCGAPYEVDPRPPRKRQRCDIDPSLPGKSVADTEVQRQCASPSSTSTSSFDSDAESNYSEVIPLQSQKLLAQPPPPPPLPARTPRCAGLVRSRKNPSPLRKNPSPMQSYTGLKQKLPLTNPPLEGLNSWGLVRESSDGSCSSDSDYVDPKVANLRRSRDVVKRERAREKRAAAGKAKAAAALGGRPENIKRNLVTLFQPQSPLVNENLRVRCVRV